MCDAYWAQRLREVLDRGGPRIEYMPIVNLWSSVVVGFEALARFPGTFAPDVWFSAAAGIDTALGDELELAAIRNAIRAFADARLSGYLSLNALRGAALPAPRRGAVPAAHGDPAGDHRRLDRARRGLSRRGALGGGRPPARRGHRRRRSGGWALRRCMWRLYCLMRSSLTGTSSAGCTSSPRSAAGRSFRPGAPSPRDSISEIVAEGVERPEEVTALRAMGATSGQGWFYSKAKRAEELRGVVTLP